MYSGVLCFLRSAWNVGGRCLKLFQGTPPEKFQVLFVENPRMYSGALRFL